MWRLTLAVGVIGFGAAAPAADRPVVGKSSAPAAAVARREPGKTAFDYLPEGADVIADDLLIPLPGAVLRNKDGSFEVVSRADFEGKSPFPILETAVVFHANTEVDLDVSLDRGRIDVANRKSSGPAVAVVRFHGRKWLLSLEAPGTRVAIETYGRWSPGTPFRPDPKPDYAPTTSVVAVVVSGEVLLDNGQTTSRLTAPPGPSLVQWTSTEGQELVPQKLDRLPEWADPDAKTGGAVRDALEKYRRLRAEQPGKATDVLLSSESVTDQRIGLIAAGAEDDLKRLAEAITAAHTPEVWDFGMSVVRHWIGRGPGQDAKLYDFLVGTRGYTPPQAATLMRLLHGFGEDDAKRPETYEVLIEYLNHDKPAVRNLAAWHLVRLAPAGKDIPFRPNAGKAEFEAVYLKWKALIPPGRLPPAPGTKD